MFQSPEDAEETHRSARQLALHLGDHPREVFFLYDDGLSVYMGADGAMRTYRRLPDDTRGAEVIHVVRDKMSTPVRDCRRRCETVSLRVSTAYESHCLARPSVRRAKDCSSEQPTR